MKLNDMWWAPLLQLPAWFMFAFRSNWTPIFPRAWRGRRVTVVSGAGRGHGLQKDKMAAIRRDRFELQSSPYTDSLAFYRFKDEGVTWCVGHEGPQVNALASANALELT